MTRHCAGFAAVVALAVLSWPAAAAGQAYRCEVNGRVTFQQQPCTDGKRVSGANGVTNDSAAAPLRGAVLCESHARSAPLFADPQDLRIHVYRLATRTFDPDFLRLRLEAPSQTTAEANGSRPSRCQAMTSSRASTTISERTLGSSRTVRAV